jgi:hypothetical protein
MGTKEPGCGVLLDEMDEIEANVAVIAGVRQTLIDELAEITRLTNEHIAACDRQIALLRAEKEDGNAR